MSQPLPIAPHTPRVHVPCPRCGYDLSGVRGIEAEGIPDTRACSECGLPLDWAWIRSNAEREARRNRQQQPKRDRFSFEHGTDRNTIRFVRTAMKCTLPESVYVWISPREHVRFSRLNVFVATALVLWCLLVAVPAVTFDLWSVGSIVSGVGGKSNQTLFTLTELVVLQGGAMSAGVISCAIWSVFLLYPNARTTSPWSAKRHALRVFLYAAAGTMIAHVLFTVVQWCVLLAGMAMGVGLLAIPLLIFTQFAGFMYYMAWCAMWPGATVQNYFGEIPPPMLGFYAFLLTLILSIVFIGTLASF